MAPLEVMGRGEARRRTRTRRSLRSIVKESFRDVIEVLENVEGGGDEG